jgi:hypothetical protein
MKTGASTKQSRYDSMTGAKFESHTNLDLYRQYQPAWPRIRNRNTNRWYWVELSVLSSAVINGFELWTRSSRTRTHSLLTLSHAAPCDWGPRYRAVKIGAFCPWACAEDSTHEPLPYRIWSVDVVLVPCRGTSWQTTHPIWRLCNLYERIN